MESNFFKGTSVEQDPRFKNKEAKLLKSLKDQFPASYATKVDMRKVELSVIMDWVRKKLEKLLGFEDDVLSGYVEGLLSDEEKPVISAPMIHVNLLGFLNTNTGPFLGELWKLLLDAQSSPLKVPKQLVEAKKQEMKAREAQQAIQKRQEEQKAESDKRLDQVRQRERGERDQRREENGQNTNRVSSRWDIGQQDDGRPGRSSNDRFDRGQGGRFDRGRGRGPGRGSDRDPYDRRDHDRDYRDQRGNRDNYRDRRYQRRSPSKSRSRSRSPPRGRSRSPSRTPRRQQKRRSSSSRSPSPRPSKRRERSYSRSRSPPRRGRNESRDRSPRDSRGRDRRGRDYSEDDRRSPSPSRSRSGSRSRSRSRSRTVSPPRKSQPTELDRREDELKQGLKSKLMKSKEVSIKGSASEGPSGPKRIDIKGSAKN